MGCCCCCCCCDRNNQVHSAGGLERQRSCTDIGWLLVFAALSAGLGALLSWAVRKGGDPRRLLHGVDSEGNVCGRGDQQPLPGVPGSGQNTTGLTLLVLEDALGRKRHCAASCPPGYRQTVFRRCVLDSGPVALVHGTLNVSGAVIEEVVQDLATCRRELGYMGLVAIGLSVAALLLLRYCVALLVWFLLMAVSLGCVGGTFYLWFSWNARRRSAQPNAGAWLVAAVAGTTAMVLLMLTVLVLRKRIQLVTALFGEAGKALTAMPGLLLQPAWAGGSPPVGAVREPVAAGALPPGLRAAGLAASGRGARAEARLQDRRPPVPQARSPLLLLPRSVRRLRRGAQVPQQERLRHARGPRSQPVPGGARGLAAAFAQRPARGDRQLRRRLRAAAGQGCRSRRHHARWTKAHSGQGGPPALGPVGSPDCGSPGLVPGGALLPLGVRDDAGHAVPVLLPPVRGDRPWWCRHDRSTRRTRDPRVVVTAHLGHHPRTLAEPAQQTCHRGYVTAAAAAGPVVHRAP
nr:choline transporter-like protein 1 isoform X5 [Dermacentor andersoni]